MKIILLGDSITQGLGSKSVNFQAALQELLNPGDRVLNWAKTGTTLDYVESLLEELIRERPNAAVLVYGNVDGQLKPYRYGKIFPRIPGRLGAKNGSMIMPRPFYSRRPIRFLLQHAENLVRTVLRRLVYAVDGTEQWLPIEPYMETLDRICLAMRQAHIRPLICSTVFIDDTFFPGSDAEYCAYNERMRRYARENDIPFIDIYSALKAQVMRVGWKSCYNHDHFHPNGAGYLIMARQIAQALEN